MPIVSTVGGNNSVMGNTSAPESAATPSIWPSLVQHPQLIVQVTNQANGNHIDITNTVLSVTMAHGFDITISTCTIELTANPNISNYSRIAVYCNAGVTFASSSTTINGVPTAILGIPLRFVGINLRTEANLWPHTWSLVCRGPLYMATQYRVPPFVIPGTATLVPAPLWAGLPIGIMLFTNVDSQTPVVNGLLSGPGTDAQAIVAILNLVAHAASAANVPGGLPFDPGLIGGTSAVFGASIPTNFLWSPYRSAMDMIQQFDQICLGFRTYETYAGRPIRTQVYAYPYGPGDTSLTEGIDVWEGSSGVRSVEQLFNAVSVEGATIPGGDSGVINSYIQSANPFQPGSLPIVDQLSSQWIENSDLVPGVGLSTVDVANWRLAERNRELVWGQWVTYRDDLFLIGHVININVPHTALTENVWVQRIELKITAEPVSFTQTIYGIGGGLPGSDPPYTPPNIIY